MPKPALPAAASAAPLPQLQAAGKRLATTPNRMGWLQPTPGDAPVATIRQRLREQGYVWLKGFLPPAEVQGFRAQVFGHLNAAGFVAAPLTGTARGSAGDKELANRRLMEFVRSARYEAFCMHPRLWQFMDELLEGLSYLHKRKIMRYTLPATPQVTPAHYDLVYLRGGTDRIVTAWIPIGDVPVEMGGLVYLEGSHALGVKMEAEFRALEQRVILRLLEQGPQVLSTGGGAFMNAQTREAIAAHGVSVWLKADLDLLMERVSKKQNRPLLKTPDPRATLQKLMEDRYPTYALADITVPTRDERKEVIAEEVIAALRGHFGIQAAVVADEGQA